MSHIVTIKTEVRDAEAVKAACKRLGLDEPVQGTARLFEGEATGLLVKLPGWLYPAVVDTDTGQVQLRQLRGSVGRPEAPRRLPAGVRRREGQDRGHGSGATASSSSPSPTAPSS